MTRLQQSTTDDALSRDQTRIQRDLEEEESNQSRFDFQFVYICSSSSVNMFSFKNFQTIRSIKFTFARKGSGVDSSQSGAGFSRGSSGQVCRTFHVS